MLASLHKILGTTLASRSCNWFLFVFCHWFPSKIQWLSIVLTSTVKKSKNVPLHWSCLSSFENNYEKGKATPWIRTQADKPDANIKIYCYTNYLDNNNNIAMNLNLFIPQSWQRICNYHSQWQYGERRYKIAQGPTTWKGVKWQLCSVNVSSSLRPRVAFFPLQSNGCWFWLHRGVAAWARETAPCSTPSLSSGMHKALVLPQTAACTSFSLRASCCTQGSLPVLICALCISEVSK